MKHFVVVTLIHQDMVGELPGRHEHNNLQLQACERACQDDN